jgi:hypothetical protein
MLCVVPITQRRALCRGLRSWGRGTATVNIPLSPVHLRLRKRLRFYAYKIQYLRKLLKEDYAGSKDVFLCFGMLLPKQKLVFRDEATLHIAVCVNRYCCRVGFQEIPKFLWNMKDAVPKCMSGLPLDRTGIQGL